MIKTHVLVVNRNCLTFLKDCIGDLLRQTVMFNLTIVDNNSNEVGTNENLENWDKQPNIKIIRNSNNKPLNHIWNDFYKSAHEPYLCFLNNDVRIPKNFIQDSELLFDQQIEIGITCHASNHSGFQKTTPLNYEYLDKMVRQGWDFTIRKDLYEPVPLNLLWYSGDDWVFRIINKKGFKAAVITSSPIIHFQGSTDTTGIDGMADYLRFKKTKLFIGAMRIPRQSKVKPEFQKIIER